jgi:hypothetical protein
MPVDIFELIRPYCYELKNYFFVEDCLSEASSAAARLEFVMADSNRAIGITRGNNQKSLIN